MKKLILTAFAATAVLGTPLVYAESGNVQTLSGGIFSNALSLDYGNAKSSTSQVRGAGKILQSDVSFFPVGRVSSFECIGTTSSDAQNQSGTSQCLVIDSDGDKLRQNFVRTEVTQTRIKGTVELLGLTGKYSGATGTGTYELQVIQGNGVTYLSNLVQMKVSK